MKISGFTPGAKKLTFLGIILVILTSGLILSGCSDDVSGRQVTRGIPSDLRNTAWTRQISDSESVTISFRTNAMTMTSNIPSSQYNQEWEYVGAYCCGYGYCRFYNGGGAPFNFSYTNSNGALNINGANMRSLNGNWARK